MLFIKVPKGRAESTRNEVRDSIAAEYSFINEGDFVYIPVTGKIEGYEHVELEAEARKMQPKKITDVLSSVVDVNELTTSFDILGNIAIVEIPESLCDKEAEIGQAVLEVHKPVNTVYKKLSAMKGEYRVRELALIAGEDNPVADYRENGVRMRFDVRKVYFSVRLSHERKRISGMVRGGEEVLVMFAGVGPFALVIARANPEAKITAIELNPDAVIYMEENIRLNGFQNIQAIHGDVKEHRFAKKFDRIIMPLPHSAHEFMDQALAASKKGTVIHYYSIVRNDDPVEDALSHIDREKFDLLFSREVRPYSKDQVQVVLDLRVR